jgi:hypothetical protein
MAPVSSVALLVLSSLRALYLPECYSGGKKREKKPAAAGIHIFYSEIIGDNRTTTQVEFYQRPVLRTEAADACSGDSQQGKER